MEGYTMVAASDTPAVPSSEVDSLMLHTDIKLPTRTKLGWGFGGFCEAVMANGMPMLVNPIYNIALKRDPVKLGVIRSLPRFVDAAYDIWLDNLSDNARTRWGRRRPFIAVGAVLCAIFFTADWWMPLRWSAAGQLWFFGIMSSGYWLSFSTFAIPYNALRYELTSEFNERTSVQAYRFFMIQVGGLVLASLYPLCFMKGFAGHSGGRIPPEVTGARLVTLLFGVAVVLMGLAPAIFGREQHVADRQPRVPLMAALRLTFTDRLFLHFMSTIVVSIFGVTIASSVGLYVTIY